jgi:hypothetical protein
MQTLKDIKLPSKWERSIVLYFLQDVPLQIPNLTQPIRMRNQFGG